MITSEANTVVIFNRLGANNFPLNCPISSISPSEAMVFQFEGWFDVDVQEIILQGSGAHLPTLRANRSKLCWLKGLRGYRGSREDLSRLNSL